MALVGIGQSPNLKRQQKLAMTPALRQAMVIMAMRVGDLRRFAISASEENPYLEAILPELPHQNFGDDQGFDFDRIDYSSQHPTSLIDHIMPQIGMAFHDPDEKAMAFSLVEHLAPSGWLDSQAWDICSARGMTQNEFDHVLSKLQKLEPTGIFARNLAECLKLQLDDLDLLNDNIMLVLNHLDWLHEGIDRLSEKTGLSEDKIMTSLSAIRRCQPKPGAGFTHDQGDIFHPDMTIDKTEQGFVVTINQGMMPSLVVHKEDTKDEASKLLLKQAQEDARLLSRTLVRRHEMLLALGQKFIQHQSAFIDNGETEILPLTMASLAEEMGVHKTTIGRIVSDKLVMTPRGMLALEDFFSPRVNQPDGQAIASRKIIATLRALLNQEDQASPMNDQELALALEEKGIIVARRTIAKYRQKIGYSSHVQRQKR